MGFDDRQLLIGSWNQDATDDEDIGEPYSLYVVNSMDRAKCVNFMAPVVDLRNYEHCFTLQDSVQFNLYHGAALLNAYTVFGIFSWGERQNKIFPFVILRIADFKDWLEDVIVLNNAI
ncbi:PREDICTED: uncharacterized protein LOC106109499 [Papilio polytes]|uniref:uncharacterized protein LOC106109499 n=1 Tax=Papilio polytes TaxID=76194 RepID=UPI00067619A5|nr:PREDICTED: uncharacterized protein LOC106109499 [Papilio polytes]